MTLGIRLETLRNLKDSEYFHRRLMAETELAYAATNEIVARRHAELALRYQSLEDEAEGRTPSEVPTPAANDVRPSPNLGVHWDGTGGKRSE